MSRLLVVGRSELLAWTVAKVAPAGVEIERATTFAEAEKKLAENPPDAALFNLVPCHPNWRKLLNECTGNGRLIPFFCMAEVNHYESCGCSLPCRKEDLITENLPGDQFGEIIAALMEECGQEDPPRFRHMREKLSKP